MRSSPKRWRRWLWLAVPALLLLGVGLAANPLARRETRRLLSRSSHLDSNFEDASLDFFPPTYRVRGLTILLRSRRSGEPLLRADEISVRLLLLPLLRGRLVVDAMARKPRVVMEQPGPGPDPHLPEPSDFPVAVLLRQLQIEGGAVRYVWVRKMNVPELTFHGIEATLGNVPSRPDLTDGPITLEAHGQVGKVGKMTASVEAESFEPPFTFEGKSEVAGFDVSEMNELVEAQKGFGLKPGSFFMTMTFRSNEGKVSGRVTPLLLDSGIVSAGGGVMDGVKAELARISLNLSGPADGTQKSGAIAVSDDLRQPGRQLLPALEKVVENGFLLGMQEGLKRVQGGGAKEGEASEEKKPSKLRSGE